MKNFRADDVGESLIAVKSGRPQAQFSSSTAEQSVLFRDSGVLSLDSSKVRLLGSVIMRVASVSSAGNEMLR